MRTTDYNVNSMTPDEFERLRHAADRDVEMVVRACAPLDWKDGDWKEAKEATGCIHPLEQIGFDWLAKVPKCRICLAVVDGEALNIRLEGRVRKEEP